MNQDNFIHLWNSAESVKEFCEISGYNYSGATHRASQLRGQGLNVKKFKLSREFYQQIGSKGGQNGHTSGFYNNPERARLAGQKGGRISRRVAK